MTDILDLVRGLPATEDELRKRQREFGQLLAEKVLGWQWRKSSYSGRRCLYPSNRYPSHMMLAAYGDEEIVSDFDETVARFGFPDPWDLVTAKAATDAMVARGWIEDIQHRKPNEFTVFMAQEDDIRGTIIQVWKVSSEALSRSAAALLACAGGEDGRI